MRQKTAKCYLIEVFHVQKNGKYNKLANKSKEGRNRNKHPKKKKNRFAKNKNKKSRKWRKGVKKIAKNIYKKTQH